MDTDKRRVPEQEFVLRDNVLLAVVNGLKKFWPPGNPS
jgi:hypothetical protein